MHVTKGTRIIFQNFLYWFKFNFTKSVFKYVRINIPKSSPINIPCIFFYILHWFDNFYISAVNKIYRCKCVNLRQKLPCDKTAWITITKYKLTLNYTLCVKLHKCVK